MIRASSARTSAAALALAAVSALALWPAATRAQTVFRSHQSANLPTAAMLGGASWLFEISHRFDYISNGVDDLWGLDGPVFNRLGLTYVPHSRLMLSVLRSNRLDNLELNAKFLGVSSDSASIPWEVAAQGGVAWNTDVFETGGATDNEMQAYVQVIANARLSEGLAVGVVPTFLRNPRLLDQDSETAFVVGLNGQYYLDSTWSILGEWIFSEARPQLEYDSGTFGMEIRTRGHFFKLLVTNQQSLNPTQVLAGANADFFDTDSWRFGFNITRLLPF